MRSIPVDTSALRFMVTAEPEQVVDFETKAPKADRDGQPIHAVEVLVGRDGAKSELITVKIAGPRPSVTEGQKVKIDGLEARAWLNDGRAGVSYSAVGLSSAAASSKAA